MAHPTNDIENPDTSDHDKSGCCKQKPGAAHKPVLIEFRDFILGGNLIRIAVAFVLALALEQMIKQFVESFITPIIGIIGARSVEDLTFTIRDSAFRYGLFLDSLISFILICIVLFFCLILPLQRYGGRCVPSWVIRKCPYCFTDMPAIGTKCPACCSSVEPLPITPKSA